MKPPSQTSHNQEIITDNKRTKNLLHHKNRTDKVNNNVIIAKSNPPTIHNSPNDALLCIPNDQDSQGVIDYDEYIKQIHEVYSSSPHLRIDIINSFTLPKCTSINIDPFGMVDGSLRLKKDGFTYFGFTESVDDKSIDFLIKPKTDQYEEKYLGKHFYIRFDPKERKYFIKDLGFGFGTFSKIIKHIKIKDNYLINLGNTFLVFMFGGEEMISVEDNSVDSVDNKTLNVRVFSGNGKSEPKSFNPNIKKVAYIGRDPSLCDICIDDNLLSRVHCTLLYTEECGWVLRDGKKENVNDEGKSSTNGTWIYLMEESEVVDGMIFKGNQNLFECKYEYLN